VGAPFSCDKELLNRFAVAKHKLKIMYALKNKVQLIGHLGNKPEVKETGNGKKVTNFSMATSDVYRNARGEKVTETQWHRLVAWGKIAEIAGKYLDKGREIAIEGRLTNRSYLDKEGNKKYITEIVVNELLMLDGKLQ
jgi:single-strand DNA-binding protein